VFEHSEAYIELSAVPYSKCKAKHHNFEVQKHHDLMNEMWDKLPRISAGAVFDKEAGHPTANSVCIKKGD
jgi:hypothetical protein